MKIRESSIRIANTFLERARAIEDYLQGWSFKDCVEIWGTK
jgi:hypothetical protein